jgi:hypothetical protein
MFDHGEGMLEYLQAQELRHVTMFIIVDRIGVHRNYEGWQVIQFPYYIPVPDSLHPLLGSIDEPLVHLLRHSGIPANQVNLTGQDAKLMCLLQNQQWQPVSLL